MNIFVWNAVKVNLIITEAKKKKDSVILQRKQTFALDRYFSAA